MEYLPLLSLPSNISQAAPPSVLPRHQSAPVDFLTGRQIGRSLKPLLPDEASRHDHLSVMDSPRQPHFNSAPYGRPTLYRPAPSSQQSSATSSRSSIYQSSSSLFSLSPPSAMAPVPPQTTAAHSRQTSAAPLPSPTAQSSSTSQYFGSLHPQTVHQAPSQPRPQQQTQQSYEYRPDRTGAGTTAAETANLLNYNALVAEAAKRAQMAVLMRDLGDMEM